MLRTSRRSRAVASGLAGVVAAGALALTGGSAYAAAPPPGVDLDLDACPASRLLDPGFADVAAGSDFRQPIVCLADYGVTSGRTDGSGRSVYDGGATVTRVQMAQFVYRLFEGMGWIDPSLDPPDQFDDIAGAGAEARQAINVLAVLKVVSGKAPRVYDPTGTVTRGQMATYLAKAQSQVVGDPFSASEDYFSDDNGTTHEADVNAIASVGITTGTVTPGVYGPNQPVTRQQMASYLTRTLQVDLARDDVPSGPLFNLDQPFVVHSAGDVAVPLPGDGTAASRDVTFEALDASTSYAVALLPCANVRNGVEDPNDPTGLLTDVFADANSDGAADGVGSSDTKAATLTALNGTALATPTTATTATSDAAGALTVTVSAAAADCTVPVLWSDANSDGRLALSAGRPSEAYAAPAEMSFAAAPADTTG